MVLGHDLIAGVTVAALIVPKNLGYAGIPLQNGLYAAAAGVILYALFGTCRRISMGPSSGLAAVAASAVAATGLTSQGGIASFVAGPTLAPGLLFLVLAVLKMGWVTQFLSCAAVTGFLFGAAIDMVIGELPKINGHANWRCPCHSRSRPRHRRRSRLSRVEPTGITTGPGEKPINALCARLVRSCGPSRPRYACARLPQAQNRVLCAQRRILKRQRAHRDSRHRRPEPVFSSSATHSTWCVIGKRSKARSEVSR